MFSRSNNSKTPQNRNGLSNTVIGADTHFTGQIQSDGAVHVDGNYTGNIHCQTLLIGPTGKVAGEIHAEAAHILGEINGKVRARSILLGRTARVLGDISHETIEIAAGARLEGHCIRLDDQGAEKIELTWNGTRTDETKKPSSEKSASLEKANNAAENSALASSIA